MTPGPKIATRGRGAARMRRTGRTVLASTWITGAGAGRSQLDPWGQAMAAEELTRRARQAARLGPPRRRYRGRRARLTAAGAALTMLLAAGALLPAQAADPGDFNAGMIIADEVFFAPGAMTAAQVQAFLSDKGSGCVPSGGGVPCLKDYAETTASRAATEFCAAYAGATNESAAQIITKSARACGVNPQALIVILQKEQGLVTASGSGLTEDRFRSAMGFRCPTGLPCEPQYAGFHNQVYSAASRFQEYADYPQRFNFRAGRNNTIDFHPNASCGSSTVLIRNQATAGLYNYTPYQPNQAALDAGYGTGDACSAYGNRNFWLRFRDWFGPTEGEAYNPFGQLDAVVGAPGAVELRGWAIDPDTTASLYLWVTVDGAGRHILASASRPDVGAAYPAYGSNHGFAATIPAGPGTHRVCVTASNVGIGRHTSLGCRSATVKSGPPFGNLERVSGAPGGVELKGWVIDPDTTAPAFAWVTVDGVGRHVRADAERADVGRAYPAYGSGHGLAATIPAAPGGRRVCVTAANVGAGGHTSLGCRDVTVLGGSPVGNLERVSGVPGAVELKGWALDPDSTAPVYLWVTVDGAGRHVRADVERGDVGRAYPAYGSSHGFLASVPAGPGRHRVCVTVANVGAGGHTSLGCRDAITL